MAWRSRTPAPATSGAPPAPKYFQRVIQPILTANCTRNQAPCHKEDGAGNALGNLDVTSYANLVKRRDVLTTRPRNDPARPEQGVFGTRSPDRPNPIGLHTVRITAINGPRVAVAALEALDGTPILDVKPVLGPTATR